METLKTMAEMNAVKAERYKNFSGLKLLHIRNCAEGILSLSGCNQIFDQYTKQDVSHIDKMLEMIEWLIPSGTQEVMSDIDWLMLVLSVYFHDMGLIITKEEFEERENNHEFITFEKEFLDKQSNLEKVELSNIKIEEFIFQEYIRSIHAQRVSNWIEGKSNISNSETETLVKEINALLDCLPSKFRRDLAMICKSHHEDDLYNFNKYKFKAIYGNSHSEESNLHYIAIILRTADLLYITNDRAPSIQYRIISPTDPISIVVWQKQMAVESVKPKDMRNENGVIDESIEKNAIQITAYFNKPDQAEAYFGLVHYINYAKKQLEQSYKIIQEAIKSEDASEYCFPWKDINEDEGIEVIGFERKKLSFSIDQESILKLLVGHTLYKNSSVVVRELTQNGLDAIKLQNENERRNGESITDGEIVVSWDSEKRNLSFLDNGTGMSIYEIENFLLKVGVSRYRQDEFIKKYPGFSAISRFGIGVLTCFLVSDEIDIITNCQEEETANSIAIRTIVGKYLLKKISKDSLPDKIKKHGTNIILHLRPNIDVSKLKEALNEWIIFPQYKVTFCFDNEQPKQIGYSSPKELVATVLEKNGYNVDGKKYDIVEKNIEGSTIAFAVQYSEQWGIWEFVTSDERRYVENLICVEGIKVDNLYPFFKKIVAVVNTKNQIEISTNIERTSMKDNSASEKFKATLINEVIQYIQEQTLYINYTRKGSISMVCDKINSLLMIFLDIFNYAEDRYRNIWEKEENDKAIELFCNIPCMIVEKDAKRTLMSVNHIFELDNLMRIQNPLIDNIEKLLKQSPSECSIYQLLNTLDSQTIISDELPMLCEFSNENILHQKAMSSKEVKKISINETDSRINFYYENNNGRQEKYILKNEDYFKEERYSKKIYSFYNAYILSDEVEVEGIKEDVFAILAFSDVYFIPGKEITDYVKKTIELFDNTENEKYLQVVFLELIINNFGNFTNRHRVIDRQLEEYYIGKPHSMRSESKDKFAEMFWRIINKDEFLQVISNNKLRVYASNDNIYTNQNTFDWER